MNDAIQPHLVIVGGGFAGLRATRGLASAAVRITLLDRCHVVPARDAHHE